MTSKASAQSTAPLEGVLSVLCTPFADDGSLDESSLERLVEHQLNWEVDGIVVFGLAGELYKLTDDERRRILAKVVARVAGSVPVIAGSDHSGTEAAVQRAREAAELGADALMAYPPTFVKPNVAEIKEYYGAIAAAVEVPVIVQDAPAWTGVSLPAPLLIEIADASPQVSWVKVEAPPAAAKIRQLRAAGLHVLSGYGALHVAEDIGAGVEGFMPGCALPGLYRELWRQPRGDHGEALLDFYAKALPLLVFQMSSLDVTVAVQKQLLHRIGVIDSPRLRRPGSELDPSQLEWLEVLLERTDTRRFLGISPPAGPARLSAEQVGVAATSLRTTRGSV